jgi:hypothetical protein
MTEVPAPPRTTSTLPPASANGSATSLPATSLPATRGRPMHTRISGLPTALIAGARLVVTTGIVRITKLSQLVLRERRKPPSS